MPIPVRPKSPTGIENLVVQVTDDGSRTLMWEHRNDGFHSGCGALTETRHVYLNNSGVADRLANGHPTTVLEVGLGTGMGLLLTLEFALQHSTPVRFIAIENDWLPADVLRKLHPHDWVTENALAEQFLAFRESVDASRTAHAASSHTWQPDPNLHVEVVMEDLRDWSCTQENTFDAVYFDPFAPDSNPELWTLEVFQKMHALLLPGGSLTTYCVNRRIRDRLCESGFDVQKVPGPENGKREVLVAKKT